MERETDRQICTGSAAMWVSYRSVVVTKDPSMKVKVSLSYSVVMSSG